MDYKIHPSDPFNEDSCQIFNTKTKEYLEEKGKILTFSTEEEAIKYIETLNKKEED